MPEEVRQSYQQALAHLADADRNGIPDILERGAAGNVIAIQQSSITINGREYKTVGDMPAVVRRLFELAVGQADANRNGIPDALESTLSGLETPSPAAGASRPEFSAAVNASTLKPPHEREHIMTGLDQTAHAPHTFSGYSSASSRSPPWRAPFSSCSRWTAGLEVKAAVSR